MRTDALGIPNRRQQQSPGSKVGANVEQANTLAIKGQRNNYLYWRARAVPSLEEKVLQENGIEDNAHSGFYPI